MSDRRSALLLAGAGVAALALVAVTATPAYAAGTSGLSTTTQSTRAAAGWLTTQFVNGSHLPAPDGDHFDSKYGPDYYPNYGENADVVFGLAAAKAGASKIDTALSYLAANADAYADFSGAEGGPFDGSIAKMALAAVVAGKDPTNFAGRNLMQTLAEDECPADSTACTPGSAANIYASVSESFTVLVDARVGGSYAPSAQALDYLDSLQCSTSGGFTDQTTACVPGGEDIDSTSYAVMALTAAGGHSAQVRKAVSWLESKQTSGGYWISQGKPNANTTGLAAAALQGAGVDVSAARKWLRSQQVGRGSPGAGALKYAGSFQPTTTSATSPSVLATAQGLIGLVDNGSLATVTATGASQGAAAFAPTAMLSAASVASGGRLSVHAAGFAAGEKVKMSVHSAVTTVADVTADPGGSAHAAFTLPASLAPGAHTVELTGQSSGLSVTMPLTVTATSSNAGTSGSTGGTTAPLAATGQNRHALDLIALVGGLAVMAGGVLLALGRRHAR